MNPTFVNAPMDASMSLTPANDQTMVSQRSDVLFVLASLAVGGSERKITRMANRLKEEGTAVTLACLNGPYTLEPGIRRDVPLHKLERRGKFSWRVVAALRRMIRENVVDVVA